MTARDKVEELYKLYEKPMYYIALAVLKNHHQAEDAVSESFCKIIQHLDKLDEPKDQHTKQYIIKVIKSVSISRYRKNAAEQKRLVALDETAVAPGCFEDIFKEDTDEMILELLSPLNDIDFEIVVMRGRDDLPYSQIAEKLSMSEIAVRKRYERARKRIIENTKERKDPDG